MSGENTFDNNSKLLDQINSDAKFFSNEKIYEAVHLLEVYLNSPRDFNLDYCISVFSKIVGMMFKLFQNKKCNDDSFVPCLMSLIEIRGELLYRIYHDKSSSQISDEVFRRFSTMIASLEEKNTSYVKYMLLSLADKNNNHMREELLEKIKTYQFPKDIETVLKNVSSYSLRQLFLFVSLCKLYCERNKTNEISPVFYDKYISITEGLIKGERSTLIDKTLSPYDETIRGVERKNIIEEIRRNLYPDDFLEAKEKIEKYDDDKLYLLAQIIIMLSNNVPFNTIKAIVEPEKEIANTWNDFAQANYNPTSPICNLSGIWFWYCKNGPAFLDYYMNYVDQTFFSYLRKKRNYLPREKANRQLAIDNRTRHIDEQFGISDALIGGNNTVIIIKDIDCGIYKRVSDCMTTVVEKSIHSKTKTEVTPQSYETAIKLCNIGGNITIELSSTSGVINIIIHIPEKISDYQKDILKDIQEVLKQIRGEMKHQLSRIDCSKEEEAETEDKDNTPAPSKMTADEVIKLIDDQVRLKNPEKVKILISNIEIIDNVLKTISNVFEREKRKLKKINSKTNKEE